VSNAGQGRRAAILFNPVAGSGRADSLASRAAKLLEADGWTTQQLATRPTGGAEDVAREVADRVDLVVVAGGDGSIRETIAGLGRHSRRVPVAILPCGNANVTARELEVPRSRSGALELLRRGEPKQVDVGRADGVLFLAMVGVGWDARTVHNLDRLRKSRLGRTWYRVWADSAYVVAGLLALFVRRRDHLQIEVDGRPGTRSYCAALIANFRCYGKGWSMVPDADCASGRLHFQARKRFGFPFVAWQLLAAFARRAVPRFVSDYGEGRTVTVHADRPFRVQIDGDDRGAFTRIEIEVDPGAALIVAPLPPRPPSPEAGSRPAP
jgi:diacylglycerol kinase family enzyme